MQQYADAKTVVVMGRATDESSRVNRRPRKGYPIAGFLARRRMGALLAHLSHSRGYVRVSGGILPRCVPADSARGGTAREWAITIRPTTREARHCGRSAPETQFEATVDDRRVP